MGRKKQRIKLNCKLCGKEFEVIPSRLDTAKYCSHKCSNNRIRTDEELEKISIASKQKFIDRPELYKVVAENGKRAMKYINENGLAWRMPEGYHTEEHKKNMSKLMSGRSLSKKTRERISQNHWSKRDDADEIMDIILESREANQEYVTNRTERLLSWCEENEHKIGDKKYKKGTYVSKKTGSKEHYSSGYELEWMKKLDDDNTVKYWTKRHGIRIDYEYRGKHHKYLPDFYIEYDNKTEILETKGWVRDREMLERKIKSAKLYCKEMGYNYKIIYQE